MSIENLEPKVIWQHFSKICTFPHPSGHEEKLATYLIDYAKSKGLETYNIWAMMALCTLKVLP